MGKNTLTREEEINLKSFSHTESVKTYSSAFLRDVEKKLIYKYIKKGSKILDLGCGAGRTTAILHNDYNVIGIDISKNLIDEGRKKFPSLDLRVMNASSLKFKNNSFDAALFSFNGLDYIFLVKKRLETLREIRRVLKKNGVFILSSHNPSLPLNIRAVKTLLANLLNGRLFSRYWVSRHKFGKLIFYTDTPKNQIKAVEKQGFKFMELSSKGKMLNAKSRFLIRLLDPWPYYVFRKI